MPDARPAVVLIGPPGAGKTKVAKRVSRTLGVPFTDTDKAIVAEYGDIAAIFAEHGEPYFRALEREAVAVALQTSGVVSLGGGAVLDPRTQAELRELPVVLLTVSADAVGPRIAGAKRPLLASGGVAAWSALVEQRAPIYDSLAKARFDTSTTPMDTVAQRVVDWLSKDRS